MWYKLNTFIFHNETNLIFNQDIYIFFIKHLSLHKTELNNNQVLIYNFFIIFSIKDF